MGTSCLGSGNSVRSRRRAPGFGLSAKFGGFTGQPPSSNAFASVVQLVVAIALVVQAFLVKDILEDHLIEKLKPVPTPGMPFDDSCKLTGLLTFFLGIFYLQYVINTRIA